MRTFIAAMVCGLSFIASTCSAADSEVNSQLYGSGLHNYFKNDISAAEKDFSTAITTGTTDPRIYYFHGLTELKLGREPEAKTDFEQGAKLEAADASGYYQVGESLRRVQGNMRVTLEKYRNMARAELAQKESVAKKLRYEAIERNEKQVLREIKASMPETPAGTQLKPPKEAVGGLNPLDAPALPNPGAGNSKTGPMPQVTDPAAPNPFEAAPAAPPKATAPAPMPVAPPAEKPEANPFGAEADPAPAPMPMPLAAKPPVAAPPAAAPPAALPPDAAPPMNPPVAPPSGADKSGVLGSIGRGLGSLGGVLGRSAEDARKKAGKLVPGGLPGGAPPMGLPPMNPGAGESPFGPGAVPPAAVPGNLAPMPMPPVPQPPAPNPFDNPPAAAPMPKADAPAPNPFDNGPAPKVDPPKADAPAPNPFDNGPAPAPKAEEPKGAAPAPNPFDNGPAPAPKAEEPKPAAPANPFDNNPAPKGDAPPAKPAEPAPKNPFDN